MAAKGKSTAKSYSLEPDFLNDLKDSRQAFVTAEIEQVFELLNGTVAESVFLQMVARLGMEAIANSSEARKKMWKHVPATARGYRP